MKSSVAFDILLAALLLLTALSAPLPAQSNQSECIAHRPKYVEGVFEVKYDSGCTGHDEPELDPYQAFRFRERSDLYRGASDNAMLTDGTGPNNPLIMHAGVTVHWFTTAAQDGFHVTVTDLTTNGSGTIVLDSSSTGPIMPAFSVNGTPNSFAWEIGHESVFTRADAFCVPGEVGCDSYDAAAWAGTSPIQIKSATFAGGSQAKQFAAVSDLGGKAEVLATCSVYGGSFCIYPWYTLGAKGYHFGVDYSDTLKDFAQANQYQQVALCGGPFGANSTYCDTLLK